MTQYMDFEKPLAEIEGKAEELRALARSNEDMDVSEEAAALDTKAQAMLGDLYKSLTPWRKCQVARHPERPHCKDYIDALFTEYTPLAGDSKATKKAKAAQKRQAEIDARVEESLQKMMGKPDHPESSASASGGTAVVRSLPAAVRADPAKATGEAFCNLIFSDWLP